jgi:hypothetical protein
VLLLNNVEIDQHFCAGSRRSEGEKQLLPMILEMPEHGGEMHKTLQMILVRADVTRNNAANAGADYASALFLLRQRKALPAITAWRRRPNPTSSAAIAASVSLSWRSV